MNNVKRALARLGGGSTKHYVLLAETTRGTLVMWRSVIQDTDFTHYRFTTPDDEIDVDSAEERTLDMDAVHAIERSLFAKTPVADKHFEAVQSLLKAA